MARERSPGVGLVQGVRETSTPPAFGKGNAMHLASDGGVSLGNAAFSFVARAVVRHTEKCGSA